MPITITKIHQLDTAKALFVGKIPNPNKLNPIPVPKKAMKLVKTCYRDYTKDIKKYKHASSVNKILRKTGHQFTQQSDPREMARLQGLKTTFLNAKKYLNDAAEYFEGCAGADVIKKYSDKVDKDFAEAVSKEYIAQQDMQNGSTEFPKDNFSVLKASNLVAANSYIVLKSVTRQPNYYQKVKYAYQFAYEEFEDLLETKFRPGGSQQDVYLFNYLTKKNSPQNTTRGKANALKKAVENLHSTVQKFIKNKNKLDGIKKKYFKYFENEFKQRYEGVLTLCAQAEQELNERVKGAVHRYFMVTNSSVVRPGTPDAIKDEMVDISANIQTITDYMKDYHKKALSGENLEDTFLSIFEGLDTLIDNIRIVTPSAARIAQTQTRTEDFMKTFDNYTRELTRINAAALNCQTKLADLVDSTIKYDLQKRAERRAWATFASSIFLGLVNASLPTLLGLLTATPADAGVEPMPN